LPPLAIALPAWTSALDEAYAKAQKAMPDTGERLPRALALVRAGAVEHATQWGAYHYTVASASDPTGLRTYDVHAQAPLSCTCEAFTRETQGKKAYSCKHLLATWLYRRVLEQVSSTLAEPATAPQTRHNTLEKTPGAHTLPEAAFSLCLKGRLAGQDAQLTIRGASYAEFVANVAAVRGLLDVPAARESGSPASPPAAETPMCEWHGAMKASTKAPGTFYCTKKKADGSYCTSRWPVKGA
jgi:hypothetical protein